MGKRAFEMDGSLQDSSTYMYNSGVPHTAENLEIVKQ